MNRKNTKKLEKRLWLNKAISYMVMCTRLGDQKFYSIPYIRNWERKNFVKKIEKFRRKYLTK